MARRKSFGRRRAALVVSGATFGALATIVAYAAGTAPTPPRPTPARPAVKAAPELKPYVENVPGSLATFEMIPVPAPPGGKPFWIARTETTWDAFDVFAYGLDRGVEAKAAVVDAISRPSKPYGAPDRGFGHQGFPALAMTYLAAEQYCRWLTAKTGKTYRLPTVAEWEWAARAGNKLPAAALPAADLEKMAWYWDTTEEGTRAVGSKAANPWGLHDMLGNVAEWCTVPGGEPVVSGGSWKDKRENVHPGAREKQTPAWNQNDPQNPKSKWWLSNGEFVGFRVVREP